MRVTPIICVGFVILLHPIIINGICVKFRIMERLCNYRKTCANGGTCKINLRNCNKRCICTAEYTGKTCKTKKTGIITNSKPSITELTPVTNASTPVDNVTSPVPNVSTPVDNVTTPVPNVTTPAPNVTSPVPNVSTPVDNVTTPVPNVTTPVPNVTTPVPNVTTPVPNVTTPAPNVTSPVPNVTTPAPNVTTPAPNVTSPVPNVTTPAPNVTSPVPNVTTPAPNVTTPVPNVTTPAPNVTTPVPNVTTPVPNVTTPAPNVTSPVPNVSTPVDNVTTPVPNVTTPVPNVTTPVPNVTTPVPNVTSPVPNVSTPVDNVTTPVPNVTTPVPNVTTPAPNVSTPVDNVTTPALNVTTPVPNVTTPVPNVSTLLTNVRTPVDNVTTPLTNVTDHSTHGITTQKPRIIVCKGIPLRCIHGVCSENGFKCKCNEGWAGTRCHVPCTLKCRYGICISVKGKPLCNCYNTNGTHRFTNKGNGCEVFAITTPATPRYGEVRDKNEYWLPVGIVLGLFVTFVIVVVVVLAILWKKRAIFVLKLVYRFKAYVDEDEKDFDAFISYKSSSTDYSSSKEELFVIHDLLPKLEREFGFKICVHFRDFVPGLDITDNVLKAIESSHRTIMLISRAYVTESFWTKFEYEQAQVAVINQKQRIIPVLFENLDDITITDPTLKLILASTTYLEKPSDAEDAKQMSDFWTRLRLSMPKKRENSALRLTQISVEDDVEQAVCNNGKLPSQTDQISFDYSNKHTKTDTTDSFYRENERKNNANIACVRYTKYLDSNHS